MGRRVLAIGLLIVCVNFIFLASSANHFKVGMIWLVVDVLVWLPDLKFLSAKL